MFRAWIYHEFDSNVAAVRAELGEAAFAAAWGEGQTMTFEQAVAYALAENAVIGSQR